MAPVNGLALSSVVVLPLMRTKSPVPEIDPAQVELPLAEETSMPEPRLIVPPDEGFVPPLSVPTYWMLSLRLTTPA